MESVIKKFEIKGFLGRYKLEMDFENNVKILVAENGAGKTTLLNMLYYTISGERKDLKKLEQYDFEYVKIVFISGKEVQIERREIVEESGESIRQNYPIDISRMHRFFGSNMSKKILGMIKNDNCDEEIKHRLLDRNISYKRIKMFLNKLSEEEFEKMFLESLDSKMRIIKKEMDAHVKILPTYRRIEIDFPITYYEDRIRRYSQAMEIRELENSLMGLHFGMDDVHKRLEDIKDRIKESYRTAFAKISAQILKDISDGVDIQNEEIHDYSAVIQIIDRIDENNLNSEEKDKIKNYLKEHEAEEISSKGYNYFLTKLLQLSREQEVQEVKINLFRDVCNKYLVNKEFYFDNATLEYYFREKDKFNGKQRKVPIQRLSSGEKQIVAIFSMLYLEDDKDYIILFDEPELSLSIEWQRMILEDIYKSNKCKLLIASTHSPFIFDNELDQYAVSLEEYIRND